MSEIDDIESILKGYAGPMAHFVINKQLKVVGITRLDYTNDQLKDFITKVIESAIMDPKLAKEARKTMRKKFHL